MRLAKFIVEAREEIVGESVKYASAIPALSGQALEILRDHLPLVLEAIARDLEQPQTRGQSILKSEGRGPTPDLESAAQTHGTLRARSGLNMEQLVAEYRVLRSCVLRLWSDAHTPGPEVLADTLRFNEAVDQAVAESVTYFSQEQQRWRSIFLGVLGHDLRGPLNAVLLTADVMRNLAPEGTMAQLAATMLRNGRHMQTLLDSLLEYSRSEVGMPMKLNLTHLVAASALHEEMDLLRTALPGVQIDFKVEGDTSSFVDGPRLREAVANLVFNAAQHGSPDTPIAVNVVERAQVVAVTVDNVSAPIPEDVLQNLFEPLRRYSSEQNSVGSHLGLGLFIVREIARAHGGEATVAMANGRVVFDLTVAKAPPLA